MGVVDKALKLLIQVEPATKYRLAFYGRVVTCFLSIRARPIQAVVNKVLKMTQASLAMQKKNPDDESLASTNSDVMHTNTLSGFADSPKAKRKKQDPTKLTAIPERRAGIGQVQRVKADRPLSPKEIATTQVPNAISQQAALDARLLSEFRKFDLDNNGVITANELSAVYKRFQELKLVGSKAECDRIINELGLMDDGQITFDEFVELMSCLLPDEELIGLHGKGRRRRRIPQHTDPNPSTTEGLPANGDHPPIVVEAPPTQNPDSTPDAQLQAPLLATDDAADNGDDHDADMSAPLPGQMDDEAPADEAADT
eukprot:NODE_2502_length_1050_cov_65.367281_g2484_i0.p1 GENE.NODE_2502_length_1050_cov_65.367281_g2484_i0~~NODE_2502_length_1050_cov_65.367281_g2484_i0.p1  ORF type:complete len:339 (-),score=71.83 NODE_2502_length_1050_cov_65.367281_g2484_i0:33-971(-)